MTMHRLRALTRRDVHRRAIWDATAMDWGQATWEISCEVPAKRLPSVPEGLMVFRRLNTALTV